MVLEKALPTSIMNYHDVPMTNSLTQINADLHCFLNDINNHRMCKIIAATIKLSNTNHCF